ncbi:hypothetical protein CALVIDRAFT_526830 [Calocera viscosa TUFC12733]|uniref:DUF6532 domain-containing protein n=1 Tax=Calocera viscosa (strain TUFC12733) TaxID=1330018 RepID=A0A167N2Y7_CALVF|nr:hypothetical protein CALVIDRAFT_526830 [Calocera viscosa TUFC12733]
MCTDADYVRLLYLEYLVVSEEDDSETIDSEGSLLEDWYDNRQSPPASPVIRSAAPRRRKLVHFTGTSSRQSQAIYGRRQLSTSRSHHTPAEPAFDESDSAPDDYEVGHGNSYKPKTTASDGRSKTAHAVPPLISHQLEPAGTPKRVVLLATPFNLRQCLRSPSALLGDSAAGVEKIRRLQFIQHSRNDRTTGLLLANLVKNSSILLLSSHRPDPEGTHEFRLQNPLYRLNLAMECAFPDEVTSDKWVEETFIECAESLELLQSHYTRRFVTDKAYSDNIRMIVKMPLRVYEHPCIRLTAIRVWFKNRESEGVVYQSKFAHAEPPALALLVTAVGWFPLSADVHALILEQIHCSLDQWSAGTKASPSGHQFSRDAWSHIYFKHLNSIQNFAKAFPNKFKKIMNHIFVDALVASGVHEPESEEEPDYVDAFIARLRDESAEHSVQLEKQPTLGRANSWGAEGWRNTSQDELSSMHLNEAVEGSLVLTARPNSGVLRNGQFSRAAQAFGDAHPHISHEDEGREQENVQFLQGANEHSVPSTGRSSSRFPEASALISEPGMGPIAVANAHQWRDMKLPSLRISIGRSFTQKPHDGLARPSSSPIEAAGFSKSSPPGSTTENGVVPEVVSGLPPASTCCNVLNPDAPPTATQSTASSSDAHNNLFGPL